MYRLFEYVQLRCQLEHDSGNRLINSDATKVRMARWRVSLGLAPEPHLV